MLKKIVETTDDQRKPRSNNNTNNDTIQQDEKHSSSQHQHKSNKRKSTKQDLSSQSASNSGASTPTKFESAMDDSADGGSTAVSSPATAAMMAANSASASAEYLLDEIELVFHPHPDFTHYDSRYIKTTSNATMAHLSRFLLVRARLDKDRLEGTECDHFKIFALTEAHDYHELEDSLTLGDAFAIHWREHKPLELFFSPVY